MVPELASSKPAHLVSFPASHRDYMFCYCSFLDVPRQGRIFSIDLIYNYMLILISLEQHSTTHDLAVQLGK